MITDDEKRGDDTVLDDPVPEPEVGRDLLAALVSVSVVPSLTELSPVVPWQQPGLSSYPISVYFDFPLSFVKVVAESSLRIVVVAELELVVRWRLRVRA